MSTTSDNAAAGRRPGRAIEKSSFAQTCNLLSQYLKEKRSLGITPKDEFPTARPPTIMNLLTNMENPEEKSASAAETVVFTSPPARQMTIFYDGQVLVFNDLPSETAEEIMAMAGKVIVPSSRSTDKVVEPTVVREQGLTKVSKDLPIARRASLHRFFEKRKDRVAAKAPYQVNSQPERYTLKNGDKKENQQSSNQFDLNL